MKPLKIKEVHLRCYINLCQPSVAFSIEISHLFNMKCNTGLSRSSRSQMFFKIDLLKNFAIFVGKLLCWSLFLIKLQALKPATLLKRLQHMCFPVNTAKFRLEIFKNSFFQRTPPVATSDWDGLICCLLLESKKNI